MSTPIEECFGLVTNELYVFITWLTNHQLFGVPILGYVIAIAVTGLAIDYIFG